LDAKTAPTGADAGFNGLPVESAMFKADGRVSDKGERMTNIEAKTMSEGAESAKWKMKSANRKMKAEPERMLLKRLCLRRCGEGPRISESAANPAGILRFQPSGKAAISEGADRRWVQDEWILPLKSWTTSFLHHDALNIR
jgi:hypothetical protein